MRLLTPLAAIALLAGCASIGQSGDAYRIRLADGSAVQCKSAKDSDCGLTLAACSNKHEYHCLHAIDLEVVDPLAPLPAALAPAPAAPPPAAVPQAQPKR